MSLWSVSGMNIRHKAVGQAYNLLESPLDQDFYPSSPATSSEWTAASNGLTSYEKLNKPDTQILKNYPESDLDLENIVLFEDLAHFDAVVKKSQFPSRHKVKVEQAAKKESLDFSSKVTESSLHILCKMSGSLENSTHKPYTLPSSDCYEVNTEDSSFASMSHCGQESSLLVTVENTKDTTTTDTSSIGIFSSAMHDCWDSNERFQDLSSVMDQDGFSFSYKSVDSSEPFADNTEEPNVFGPVYEEPSTSHTPITVTALQSTQQNSVKRVCKSSTMLEEISTGSKMKVPRLSDSDSKSFSEDRYQEMRRKNNIASRRSRMTRKEKEKEMEERSRHLEQENDTLRVKIKKLEEIIEELKKHLINVFVEKK
ncbi:uncharacterized protein LOC143243158 [Tachypleus tridentatus]|uniref:uncharacterized protein LOC143243158 n=1 Tax=Tachypleus tridentatus TaxID=6853 RepID=UPI003FD53564